MLESEQPFRDPKHKWYEPVENWPGIWPRAASGSGYLLDRALLSHMLVDDSAHQEALSLQRGQSHWHVGQVRGRGTWAECGVRRSSGKGRHTQDREAPGHLSPHRADRHAVSLAEGGVAPCKRRAMPSLVVKMW